MRFILSFALMPFIALAFQTCSKSSMTAKNTVQTNTNATNSVVQNSTKTAVSAPTATPGEAPRISLEEAKKEYDNGAAFFVDTRPEAAYNVEHIKGAINIPLDAMETRFSELPKDKKIIAYCS